MKHKLSLAIAVLGDPPVLMVDNEVGRGGAPALRASETHSMEAGDTLATRASITFRRLLAVGTTRELREAYRNVYHLHLVSVSAPVSPLREMVALEWVTETFSSA